MNIVSMFNFITRLFSEILIAQCSFCGDSARELICENCTAELLKLEAQDIKSITLKWNQQKLVVFYLCIYNSWLKKIFEYQKLGSQGVHPVFSEKISELLLKKTNFIEPKRICWLPGSSLKDSHLVEKIILKFLKNNWKSISKNPIKRKLIYGQNTKTMSQKIRRKNDLRKKFNFRNAYAPKELVLFDDVMTTGTTLMKTVELLKEQQVTVSKALVLAYTPLASLVTF